MNTGLYDEYEMLCRERAILPHPAAKFNYVGGEAELLELIRGLRAKPAVEPVVK